MDTKLTFNLNKLYIIADFDHTLTTKESQNCWGILSSIPNISTEYIKKSSSNNNYYFPIEQDDKLDYKIKNKMMKEWYQKHTELLIKYNLKEDDISEIGKSHEIILRKGVIEFLKFTNKKNIPVIIISAGISNIIESVLKRNNCFYSNVYVISNIFKFKNGKLKSLRNSIIHSLNKNKVEVPPKIKEIIKDKDEVIIIGDNIGDTLMKLKDNKKTYKIGFLNYNNKDRLNNFKQYFDIVYKKDDSFLKIKDMIDKNSL